MKDITDIQKDVRSNSKRQNLKRNWIQERDANKKSCREQNREKAALSGAAESSGPVSKPRDMLMQDFKMKLAADIE
jgi:hypothetical protein